MTGKQILIYGTLAAMCAGAVSCSHSDNTTDPDFRINLNPFSCEATMQCTDPDVKGTEMEYMRMRATGVLPQSIDGKEITALTDTLMKLSLIARDTDGHLVALPADSTWRAADAAHNGAATELFTNTYTTVASISPTVMVWSVAWQQYEGGAHGMYGTDYVNYSLTDKRMLSLSDIFKPDATPRLKELIAQNIPDDISLLIDPKEAELPSQFQITAYGIEFYYELYEIAPYAAGIVTSTVGLYDLKPLLRPGIEKLFAPAD